MKIKNGNNFRNPSNPESFDCTIFLLSVTPEQKIEAEPRFIEEEGLYVGQKPAIAARNKRRLESRLLKEGSTVRWRPEPDTRTFSS